VRLRQRLSARRIIVIMTANKPNMEFVILFNEMCADRIQIIVLAVNQVKIGFDEVLQRT
jgi:hypothetical protein